MQATVLVFLCFFGVTFSEQWENAPNLVSNCKLTDRYFLQCWKRTIDILRPTLTWGIPELSIPPLEPISVPPFRLTRNVSSVATYHVAVSNFFFSGGSNFEIFDYHVNPDALTLRLKVGVPKLDFSGVSNGAGNIFGMPFHGTGRSYGTITNLIVDILLRGGKYNQDGKFYIQWKEVSTNIKYKDFLISLQNHFPEPVSSAISQRISQSRDLFESHVRPVLEYSLVPYIVNILNNIHARYPFNALYPKV